MSKLRKRRCYVIVYLNREKVLTQLAVIAVFKKKTEAEKYLKRLNPKDIHRYAIKPSYQCEYENKEEYKITWTRE